MAQMSLYRLKPAFQRLLQPAVHLLHRLGVSANQVTVPACAVSVALGLALYLAPLPLAWLALLPLWLFLRMALNAIDGMLAREFDQRTVLGAYLNEFTDVIADAALYLPFARLAGFDPLWIGALVLAAALSEMAGTLALIQQADAAAAPGIAPVRQKLEPLLTPASVSASRRTHLIGDLLVVFAIWAMEFARSRRTASRQVSTH